MVNEPEDHMAPCTASRAEMNFNVAFNEAFNKAGASGDGTVARVRFPWDLQKDCLPLGRRGRDAEESRRALNSSENVDKIKADEARSC